MKVTTALFLLLLSLGANAQAFIGLGTGTNFYNREELGKFTFPALAGIYAVDNNNFHCGFMFISQNHKYEGRLKKHTSSYYYASELKFGEQLGITPAIFFGPTIDAHLSFGLMAGYEMLAHERFVTATFPPFEVSESSEYKFQHGRFNTSIYANVRVFENTRLTPMLHARYGLLFNKGSAVQDISLSVCLFYDWRR
jgi:hypothetical protein